jgi:glycogen debranching enzyme
MVLYQTCWDLGAIRGKRSCIHADRILNLYRYNSRDSPWWMLQAIQDYVANAPDGLALLSESVKRRFPVDDSWVPWDHPRAYSYSSTIAEIIQEILQRHAEGISFREYNAGPALDSQMKDEGFNIDIKVDWNTGIIFGGNQHNCGTWMDKMGESEKAGTKGVPGTPRDGAPVEITGLMKSTLRWLDEIATAGKFPFKGVQAESGDHAFETLFSLTLLFQSRASEGLSRTKNGPICCRRRSRNATISPSVITRLPAT